MRVRDDEWMQRVTVGSVSGLTQPDRGRDELMSSGWTVRDSQMYESACQLGQPAKSGTVS